MTTLEFTKGHGTRNDFVLLLDEHGRTPLDADLVRMLADRRSGVGGDGVIRAVRAEHVDADGGVTPEAWFMDYWNADGSVAEMCGNGARVFGAFLEGVAGEDTSGGLTFGTRSGAKTVTRVGEGRYSVDMGPWRIANAGAGVDAQVTIPGLEGPRPGLSVDVGNPHVVIAVVTEEELAAADLSAPPAVDPPPPHGTNVEVVVPFGERLTGQGQRRGHVRMRVHERGSGETESCGTGACAVALALRAWAGPEAPDVWDIDVPGGAVTVYVEPHRTVLEGPAELVARGNVTLGSDHTRR